MLRSLRLPASLLATLLAFVPTARAQMGYLVDTWATSPMALPPGNAGIAEQTLREVVHVSISGSQFTVVTLSNEFGREPLTIKAVTLAHRTDGSTTDTPVAVTFGHTSTAPGTASVVIPPGQRVLSDEIPFTFAAQSDVVVNIDVPAQTITSVTAHGFANSTNYVAPGDQTAAPQLTAAQPISSWRYLVNLGVATVTQHSIVCLGDSITDGSNSARDANHRWPDLLAARLLSDKRFGTQFGVLNEGIGGNRILHEGTGPSAIDRFDRDVLDTHGYYADGRKYVIVLEGINDIGHAYGPNAKRDSGNRTDEQVNADELIAAFHLLIVRAHANGKKIIGATLTPYVGAGYASSDGEKVRQALNAWIRTTKELDGVIDFDKATRDPANPSMFLPAYDSGDHLHPNDAGMQAMADSIDLTLFTK